jgi:hypothetical protein
MESLVHFHKLKKRAPNLTRNKTTQEHSTMNGKIILAIVLIGLGIVSLAYQGFTYTTKEKVVDFGPIQATADKKHTLPLPPILGGILLVGGIAVLVSAKRT